MIDNQSIVEVDGHSMSHVYGVLRMEQPVEKTIDQRLTMKEQLTSVQPFD
jgi:uncharacterized alkaline shock family protein YloU